MTVETSDIDKVQGVITKLEGVEKETIRAQERYNMELDALKKLGLASPEEAEGRMEELAKKIQKKTKKLEDDFNDFMEDYSEALE